MNNLPKRFHFLDVKPANLSVISIKNKIFQRKLDGTAVEVFINDENRIFGRGVLEYGIASEYSKRFPEILEDLRRLNIPKSTNFVGEIVVIDPDTGFESLKLVQTRTQRENKIDLYARRYPALLIILDVVMVGGKDVTDLMYLDRINELKFSIGDDKNNWKSEHIFFIKNDTKLDWDFIEKNNLEGIVLRDADEKFNRGIWKLKLVETEDVYCKGEYNKSDKMKEFRSIICYQLDKYGKDIHVADVGGGFSCRERKEIQNLLDSGIMKEKPLVLEIKTLGRKESLRFRNPTFIRVRYDKPWNECIIKNT
jgi:ATP-dependent DNA ligase